MLPLLAFDTSAAHCAAALLWDDSLVLREEPMEKGQAERLMPMLEGVLAEAGLGWHDLKALAVGTGPGNFTGVRIAVSASRGLALGLGIPAVGVTRLEALAYGLPRPAVAILDARKDELYVQVFDAANTPAMLLGAGGRIDVEPGAVFVGHDAEVGAASYRGRAMEPSCPLVEAIARIGAERAATFQPRPAPFYLRSADATPPSDPPPVILP